MQLCNFVRLLILFCWNLILFLVFDPAVKVALTKSLSFGERTRFIGFACGVTKLNDKIYAIFGYTSFPFSLIYIFEAVNSFRLLRIVELAESEFPGDLCSSETENCLYILEARVPIVSSSCILKLRFEQDKYECIKWLIFEDDFRPTTLSVTKDDQLLMVSKAPAQAAILRVYDTDAQLRLSTQLPAGISVPRHAVKTTKGNFIILYVSRRNVADETSEKSRGESEDMQNMNLMVGEVSRDGRTIIRSRRNLFEQDRLKMMNFYKGYLETDSEGRVFVADISNNRVILLDSELRWNQLLTPTTDEIDEIKGSKEFSQLRRILFDEQYQQLIAVGDGFNETEIHVYDAYI